MADAATATIKSDVLKGKDIHSKRFKALKVSTIKAKIKKGSRFPNKPLIDTGLMRQIFRSKSASASSLESRVGVARKRKDVATYHNDGGKNNKPPKREWFGIGTKLKKRLDKMVRAKVRQIVRIR